MNLSDEQKRELVDIKELRPEYQEIASHVLQDVIMRLKRTYDDFFRRVQNGEIGIEGGKVAALRPDEHVSRERHVPRVG